MLVNDLVKSTSRAIAIMLFLCVVVNPLEVFAQLTDDPGTLPFPNPQKPDPERAVIVKVQFNTASEVVLQSVSVANTRAPGAAGEPSHILLELLDHEGKVIEDRFAWHPLWIRHWDGATGEETNEVADSGTATFYVPLSETLRAVRITDLELAQVLITVDVSNEVAAYCRTTPKTPICALFLDDFE